MIYTIEKIEEGPVKGANVMTLDGGYYTPVFESDIELYRKMI
jgi:hypothetical protein